MIKESINLANFPQPLSELSAANAAEIVSLSAAMRPQNHSFLYVRFLYVAESDASKFDKETANHNISKLIFGVIQVDVKCHLSIRHANHCHPNNRFPAIRWPA